MDFKSPGNQTKNKFDDLDLDDLGEEILCIVDDDADTQAKNTQNAQAAQATVNGSQMGTQATGAK